MDETTPRDLVARADVPGRWPAISERLARRLTTEKRIPSWTIGRRVFVSAGDVERYLSSCARPAVSGHERPASIGEVRVWALAWTYGLTPAERDLLEQLQEARCPVCGEPLGGVVDIDHDHGCCPTTPTCGQCIRGIVHRRCNAIVGRYESARSLRDPQDAERAAAYLASTAVRMALFYAARAQGAA